MANQIWKAAAFKIDGASATIIDLTSYTNQNSISASHSVLEDSAFGTEEATFVPGIENSTFDMNGWVNSTTDGVFGPLVGNRTSISKTFGVYNGIKWYTGECYPTNVQYSGSVNTLLTWSASFQITGAVTRTSTAPA